MLKAAGEAKAADRTRVVEQARAADVPKGAVGAPFRYRGHWVHGVLRRASDCRVAGGRVLAVEAT